MKNKWTQASNIGTTAGGGLTGNVCPQYAAVGRTAPHKKNSCYFDPKKMIDRREWARKLMDEKQVAWDDDEWRRGTEKTVVHRNSIKVHLSYEYSLGCSSTPRYIPTPAAPRILPQKDMGVVDSGAIHLYIAPSAPHSPPNKSAS